MALVPTILLIGLRGCGKSTIGGKLAHQLGIGFSDLDALTLQRLGFATVSEAWTASGESAFRTAEAEALRSVLEPNPSGPRVISLGGGTPTAPGCAELIRDADALTIYCRATPSILRDRLTGNLGDDRPSLTGNDPLDEIERVFEDRDALYTDLADHVVELTAHEQPDETLARLVGLIGRVFPAS